MNKSILYLSILMGFILFPIFGHAQYIADHKKTGDHFFEQQDYYAAAVYYQKALKLLPDGDYYLPYNVIAKDGKIEKKDADNYEYLVYQLGEAFRLYKDYKSAEGWYDKVVKFDNDRFPLARLWYGVTLRADGQYESAIEELTTFKNNYSGEEKYIERAELELASCQYALEELKYPRLATVKKLPEPVNVEEGSDYAPMRISDTLYFTSSRKIKGIKPKKHSPYINRVYKATLRKNGNYTGVQQIDLSETKYGEDAAASLNAVRDQLYFTQWEENKKGKGLYKISVSNINDEGNYQDPELLSEPVNIEGYNTKEASITTNGKYLVFSSDRPGGEGGYDLWYCKLDEEGKPMGDARNLGTNINTQKDEVNPYYDTDRQILIFSSNGKVGMGGFDLYESKGSFKDNNWEATKNLGYPINSSKDDNYYYPDGSKNRFYTSSDRNSVCCLDLYNITLKKLRLIGHVYDEDTREPIKEVETILKDSISGQTKGTLTTSTDGYFHFPLINRRPLKMHFSNDLYGTKDIVITHIELKRVDSVYERNIYLKITAKPIRIRNIYYNFDKSDLRSESKPALDTLLALLQEHSKWIVEIGSHTDALGSDKYNEWLSRQRAQSVVDFLIANGISKDRLNAKGYGESQPIAPNKKQDGSDNPEGRQLNRRTEFKIIGIIKQNGQKTEELKSEVGDTDKIKVDKSRTYHLSRSKEWWNFKL